MNRRLFCNLALALCAPVLFAGCMPKMTIEEMKAMMPKRPVELDRLNAFVGSWEATGEMTMTGLDQPLKSTGTTESKWEGDGWYIVGRSAMNMSEFGDMQGVETWTYDTHSKKYRSTWTDSMGSVGTGTATFNPNTNTWKMKATSHGPFGKSSAKGSVKILDENTMEWNWTEYAMGGLFKVMEINGTSKRR